MAPQWLPGDYITGAELSINGKRAGDFLLARASEIAASLGTEVVRLGVKGATLADSVAGDVPVQLAYVSPASGYVSIYRKAVDGVC